MKRKINYQLMGIAILAITITLISMLTIFYDVYKKQVKDDLSTIGRALKYTGIFQSEHPGDYHFDMKNLRVTWISQDGTVLYDNDADIGTMANHARRPEIKEALEKGEGEAVRKSETLKKSTFYYAIALDDGSVLRVAKEEDNLWSIISSVVPIIAVTIVFMVIL